MSPVVTTEEGTLGPAPPTGHGVRNEAIWGSERYHQETSGVLRVGAGGRPGSNGHRSTLYSPFQSLKHRSIGKRAGGLSLEGPFNGSLPFGHGLCQYLCWGDNVLKEEVVQRSLLIYSSVKDFTHRVQKTRCFTPILKLQWVVIFIFFDLPFIAKSIDKTEKRSKAAKISNL